MLNDDDITAMVREFYAYELAEAERHSLLGDRLCSTMPDRLGLIERVQRRFAQAALVQNDLDFANDDGGSSISVR